jgi:hypothetical protein
VDVPQTEVFFLSLLDMAMCFDRLGVS